MESSKKVTTTTAPAATPASKPSVPASVLAAASQYNRLDETDLREARKLGLLLEDLQVSLDSTAPEFGIAYEKKGGTRVAGCAADVFSSQKSLQERCKQFAMQRGFQLFVSGSSTRPNGGGNVKYRCKKLNGQQFFDPDTPASKIQCPFYINGYGKDENWKITRACFLHNHYKFIGWRAAPPTTTHPLAIAAATAVTSGNLPIVSPSTTKLPVLAPAPSVETVVLDAGSSALAPPAEAAMVAPPPRVKAQRNTTMSMKALCRMVTDEVSKCSAPNVAMAKLDGKAIRRILLGQGHTINHMMASRIKRQLQEERLTKVRASFQKLGGYLGIMADKNPGSLFRVETRQDGGFTRALFIPNATLNTVKHCRKIVSLGHITHHEELSETSVGKLEDEENDDAICGVYLKAATKDFNDDVVTFALALVTEENQANWEWFLTALQSTQVADWNQYTVIAGRTRGLQSAIHRVWPLASHHFCMRRVVEDELVMAKKIPMTPEKKQSIFDLARSDSETEYDALRKALLRTNEAAVAYLDELNRDNWVKYAFLEKFRRPTFNELTSDLSMALGSDELLPQHASASHIKWFGEDPIGSSHPLYAFNQFFMKIAENFHQRRQSVKLRPAHELVPLRDAQLQQILQGSQRCESIPCANGLYMVRYLGPTRLKIPDSWRHVNLVDWECTCQDWQDQQFPCLHAIHASELEQRRIDSLYDTKQNSIENYLACYSTSFTPWPVDASPITPDTSLKTPLDFYFSEDGTGRRKPGPRPKRKRVVEEVGL
ncbi:hypothetical protein JG687_00000661 [Phytophthora cactorum]|uniref:SWIM-type domain-containing protein n=1 Tax=Phytophthora cactorum TaxID=29920 RepID=A0A329SSH4_9STRA|nr:hypothetical protein JG687_00000661 [Phytophthora cactorum]RAW39807.1 hypothetical protein PC110_g4019 [Phytophthora cactorum]